MSLAIPDELIVEGVARAFAARIEGDPQLAERLLQRMAEVRSEVLTPIDAAAMLGTTVKTLRARHAEWGLTKSVALGETNPRYFRSQVIEALHRREMKARAEAEPPRLRVVKGRAA